MEQGPEVAERRAGDPGGGRVLADAERDDGQDQGRAHSAGYRPVHQRPPPGPGQQHRDRVRGQHRQRYLVQVAAHGDQEGVDHPAPRDPPVRQAGGLGLERPDQRQRGAEHDHDDRGVLARGLRVEADGGGQRHDQAGEQAGPGRPGQPPGEVHHQPRAGGHGDHRRDADGHRAGAQHHPAVHEHVVEPVVDVGVLQQMGELAEAEHGGVAGHDLVVAHGVMPGQPPQPEHKHGGRRDRDRRQPQHGRGRATRTRPGPRRGARTARRGGGRRGRGAGTARRGSAHDSAVPD